MIMKVSAVILTKNEVGKLKKRISELAFCDEIVVIDDYSTDKSVDISRKMGCRVYQRHLNNNFAAQRNFGLAKSTGEWILFVDTDEKVSKDLAVEIKTAVKDIHNAYKIPRNDVFNGRILKYGSWSRSHLRLAKKSSGKWKRAIHEYWDVRGRIGELQNPILHYSHSDVKSFMKSINKYVVLHSKENESEGKRASIGKIILWPLGKFIQNFIVLRGYKDGVEGLIYAMMLSFHSFVAWSTHYMSHEEQNT